SGAHLRRRPRLEPESLVRPRVPAISGHTMLAANHTSAAGVAGVQYEGTIISDLLWPAPTGVAVFSPPSTRPLRGRRQPPCEMTASAATSSRPPSPPAVRSAAAPTARDASRWRSWAPD